MSECMGEWNKYLSSFLANFVYPRRKFAANSGPSMILKLCHPYDIMYCNNETELSDRFGFEREIHHDNKDLFVVTSGPLKK